MGKLIIIINIIMQKGLIFNAKKSQEKIANHLWREHSILQNILTVFVRKVRHCSIYIVRGRSDFSTCTGFNQS